LPPRVAKCSKEEGAAAAGGEALLASARHAAPPTPAQPMEGRGFWEGE